MRVLKQYWVLLIALVAVSAFLLSGQACSQYRSQANSESVEPAKANNGDYYTGITDELAKSVSRASSVLYREGFDIGFVVDRPGFNLLGRCPLVDEAVCSNGIQRVEFAGCQRGGLLGAVLSGYSQKEHNNNTCELESEGDEVLKTFDITNTNRLDQILYISSESRYDYRGVNIGGGIKRKISTQGFDVDVLGTNLSFTGPRLGLIFEHFTRGLETIKYQVIDDSNIKVLSSELEIVDNKNQWTAVYDVDNLKYSKACCHPTEGSMGVTYAGKVSGAGKIQFGTCGSAQLELSGASYPLTLDPCE